MTFSPKLSEMKVSEVNKLKFAVLECMKTMIGNRRCNLLEGKGAAVELLGRAKSGFLGWGAAEQQELVGGVHEFLLLSRCDQRKGEMES